MMTRAVKWACCALCVVSMVWYLFLAIFVVRQGPDLPPQGSVHLAWWEQWATFLVFAYPAFMALIILTLIFITDTQDRLVASLRDRVVTLMRTRAHDDDLAE